MREATETLIYKLLYICYSLLIMVATTIQLEKPLVDALKAAREYPRQTYNELIKSMLRTFQTVKKKNQYDEFLHKVQQQKMKELWDNKADEAWEHA